jgi:hypothetical protein
VLAHVAMLVENVATDGGCVGKYRCKRL